MATRASLVLLALSLCMALAACAAPGRADDPPPRVTPTEITYTATDGGVIHALLYGAGPRAVVLAHGGRFNKESWDAQAQVLVREGFSVLAIDFRGYGASTAGTAGEQVGFALDILGAVRFLRERGATSVAVVGASFGGWAAANASALAPVGAIDAIVLLAHSPIDRPDRMKGRKLFIVAENDPNADGTLRIVRIRQQYERAPQPKELLVVPGDAHAQFLFDTDQGDAVMDAIVQFLRND